MFWNRFQISVVVVIEGLRPACISEGNSDHEISSLKKSHKLWQQVRQASSSDTLSNDAVFKAILTEYGSRFYMQEIVNATKKVPNCNYFIAPYLQTTQIAQFYKDSLVQAAFGTSKLLLHSQFQQAIVDFNLKANTFTFIDLEDLNLGNEQALSNLASYMILSGAFYGLDDLAG